MLSACAGHAPVPGGDDTTNDGFFKSEDDFKSRVSQIERGMPEAQVLDILGRSANDMTKLDRQSIIEALYGARADSGTSVQFLSGLYGYRLEYKTVDKEHGLSSPIRLRTNVDGFQYKLTLIFWGGYLYDQPILAGGKVRETHSSTIFDWFSPGAVVSSAF